MQTETLKEKRESEFMWNDDETYPARSAVHYAYGDSPIKYIIALGDKDKDVALSELREIVSSWRCTCQHDCCAHRFAEGGQVRRIHGKTYAAIRTDINI